jgi:hypothetical protein
MSRLGGSGWITMVGIFTCDGLTGQLLLDLRSGSAACLERA